MATSIVSPGMASIDNAFGNIYNMFGGSSSRSGISGGSSGPFGIAPLTNPDNSLTGQWYNLANLVGPSGMSLLGGGQQLIGTGTGVAQGGLDMSGAGFGTTMQGLNTLQPTIDFYQSLLSGDPAAMTKALAPSASTLSNVYSGALTQAGEGMPGGGYRAATLAGLPQAEAAQVGNAALQLQPAAAQGLLTAGTDVANIGGTQGQIGQGVAGTGVQLGGLGAQLAGQGMTSLQSLIQDVINKMNINYQFGGPQTFNTIMQGLGGMGASGSGWSVGL